jgi:hypothetical protein
LHYLGEIYHLLTMPTQTEKPLADVTQVPEVSDDESMAFQAQEQAYYEQWDYSHLGDSQF